MNAGKERAPESKGILLFTVADVFAIEHRGCVLVPGIPDSSSGFPGIKRGVTITLRRPDGSEIQTTIKEFEMISARPRAYFATPILLPSTIKKADVPIGTEVWYIGV
jgi:hypothetical protein